MLEKPDLADEKIVAFLKVEYGLIITQVEFLPIGADQYTAVYRLIAEDGRSYFFKLRCGYFDAVSVILPRFLSDQGIAQVIPPLPTRTGQGWARLEAYTSILYPYITGQDGYTVRLTGAQWREFGAALKQIHTVAVPTEIRQQIRRENYSPAGREMVKTVLEQIRDTVFEDPEANDLAKFLNTKRNETLELVSRAEQLAFALQSEAQEFVVCHSDLHAGNLLMIPDEQLYIVDWDDPILAPKERDLMYIGGAQGFIGYTDEEEKTLFYQGYGETDIDPTALAYYRYERIVQDIAVTARQILFSTEGGANRGQFLYYLKSNYQAGNTIENAYRTDLTQGSW